MSARSEKDFFDFEDLLDSVIAVDKEGKIREANCATLQLLGYKKKEELIMLPMKQICKDISLEKIRDKIPLREEELVYLNREGKEIPVSVNIIGRILYPDDIIFIARDISKTREIINELTKSREELRKSYAELTRSKDELVRSEKLAYTGRIAASIAHEIRNPLTNVGMSLQRLAQKTSEDKHVKIIESNMERINYLITELLNCARPPKLNLRIYDIHEILKEVLESVKTKIEAQKIKVIKKFTSRLSKIQVDKEQIARAFLNIILNAIEAMRQKGELTITTEFNEYFLVVKIQDTGKGIPEEDIIRKEEGYAVIAAGDGRRSLKAVHDNVSLVLLDIRLPDMDGMDILEKMKQIDKDLIVIMLTADEDVEHAFKAMKLGAFDYITKPFNTDELLLTIKRACENIRLRRELKTTRTQLEKQAESKKVQGESLVIQKVLKQVRLVAPTVKCKRISTDFQPPLLSCCLRRRGRAMCGN